ncbi:hypothetical protein BKE38_25880 [Pseudoroseomonas deserti]|uniref:Uncharacterized protein n=1 Tax=Teichococcus deserti TaxID=1817963 RepID=A0A1V2GV09_9PROT|nr:hypothetical protein [Pseudoroseomonas deserti]ONG46000.1 hypothetical protein BKE38_25880 [Pseudoroseomonas deserti]
MSMAGVFALLAAVLLLLGWRRARGVARGDWVRDAATRLVITTAPNSDRPQLRLERGDAVVFGPVPALWQADPAMAVALGNPERLAGRPGGDAPAGDYRVLGAADLSAALPAIRGAFGEAALILGPEGIAGGDGRPLLLHAVRRGDGASQGGIALPREPFRQLLAQLGDPRGLQVRIERRHIRRGGWGGGARRG